MMLTNHRLVAVCYLETITVTGRKFRNVCQKANVLLRQLYIRIFGTNHPDTKVTLSYLSGIWRATSRHAL